MNSHTQRWVVYSLVAGLLAAGLVFPKEALRPQEKRAEVKCQPAPKSAADPLKVLLRGIIL